MLTVYPSSIYSTQRLLFEETRLACTAPPVDPSVEFYDRGWAVFDDLSSHEEAVSLQEGLLAGIDPAMVPSHDRFGDRIQLGKADLIPVCDDVVASSYQVLHFDMGLPLAEGDPQLLVTHVGIYLPAETEHEVTARTRLVELDGVLADRGLSAEGVESRLLQYTRRHGDGWAGCNTNRLACFVRIVDALAEIPELTREIDKTVGQWFMDGTRLDSEDARAQEAAFYARHDVRLGREYEILLKPGQLLFLDNTRVVHGRVGHRRAKEIFNFMFGVPSIDDLDIAAVRQQLSTLMIRKS